MYTSRPDECYRCCGGNHLPHVTVALFWRITSMGKKKLGRERYEVRFYWGVKCITDPVRVGCMRIAGPYENLETARDARVVAGDVVFDLKTNNICTDIGWLWERELRDPDSHARQVIDVALRNPQVFQVK